LFGSYTRGEADDESDVDVLVDIEKDAKLGLKYLSCCYTNGYT
jgi:predicted nucleotidyltransferase